MIALDGHPFAAAALQQYVDQAASVPLAPGKIGVMTAAVDNNGVKVALIFTRKDGDLKFAAALAHDWTGDTRFGVSGSYSF